ncbi:hypothetical protein BC827DRAFT_1159346 [Russula dissimulans]|nr:hypothetical protein BC827DRAFT_1159346 [Russula dissimulans]
MTSSLPAVTANGSPTTINPPTTSTPTTAPSTSSTNNPHIAVSPNGITFSREHVGDPSWPPALVLDLKESNWPKWSKCLILAVDKLYLSDYLTGALPCPNVSLFPAATAIWRGNHCGHFGILSQNLW